MRKWYPALLVVLAFAVGAVVYGKLPPRVPIHWDAHGRPNGWGSPAVDAFVMPCVIAGMWLLFAVIPRIDPLRSNYGKFAGTYTFLMNLVLTFMLAIHLATLGAAMGMHVDMGRVAPALIGLLFIGMGNVLPRARRNWFVGIRTPWTLSSDRVWDRTHRLGGYLFTAAGVIAVAVALIGGAAAVPMIVAVAVAAAIVLVAYSYILWRQEPRP